jgi:talin
VQLVTLEHASLLQRFCYRQLQQELNSAAANLNDASADVVSSVRSPTQLAASSRTFGTAFGDLLGVSMEMAGQTKVIVCIHEVITWMCVS